MSVKESTDLIVLDKLTPAVIFAPGGVNDILEKIAREVRHTPIYISTKSGREHCASLAYKVARSKTALDKMGKDLGDANYKAWKAITAERARIETELDKLRDEVRKPLTDWENAEKLRIDNHEQAIVSIEGMRTFDTPPTAHDIKYRLDAFESLQPRVWEEFAKRASIAETETSAALRRMLDEALKREAEAAELIRLRVEQVAREQKERDDRIAAEAAEKARLEAEQKAAREAEEAAARAEQERKRIQWEKDQADRRAEQAEADRKAASEQAELAAKKAERAAEQRQEAAIEAERKRVSDLQAKTAAETAAREANKKHRANIHNAVLVALIDLGVDSEIGKGVIVALAKGAIPHTKIEY